jgi:hypothetical protein
MKTTSEVIERAFSNVPKPANARLITPHACPECDDIAEDFLPYTFGSVPSEVLESHFSDLPLLGSAGLHHYLPAFLLYALGHPESNVLEFTVIHLTPSTKSIAAAEEYFDSRFGVFDQAQRAAIGAFFSEVRDRQLYEAHEGELDRAAELWPKVASQETHPK